MKGKTSPKLTGLRRRIDARIIWALFAKDALEALKNKNTIVVIFTSLFMVFFYRGLPILSMQGEPINVLIYDPGNSDLLARLENSRNIQPYTYPSEERMKQFLANGEVPELGLVVPANFDQALQAGENPELRGYVLRWVSENDAEALRRTVETEIGALLGRPVPIELSNDRVDLLPESGGLGEMAAFGLAYILIMTGVILIPHLMLEEKQNRTLDALSVSPASPGQIVAGKALAGLFYCSLGGVIALAVNHGLVVHWWLALLTVVLGSLFTVSLGLWLGIKIDSRAQLSMWAWAILLPLIMPVVFSLLQGLLPAAWVRIMKIIPSAVIFDLIRISFANPISIVKTLLLLVWIAAAAGLGLAVVAWTLHRRDREAETFSGPWQKPLINIAAKSQNLFATLLERISRLRKPHRAVGLEPALAAESATPEPGPPSSLAMIRIIAAKDLVEAFKNRLILSILLGSTFIILSAAALPLLLSSQNPPRIVVYDQGRSAILRSLAARQDLQLFIVDSHVAMETALASSQGLALGLILPADFDQRAGSEQTAVPSSAIALPAYFPHWAEPELLSQQAAFCAAQLSQASGAMIDLDLAGHAVYPAADLSGAPLMLLLNLVAVILVIGTALVPLLVIEEKETQTLKVLLVSPANLAQVILGKALVGLFFSLLPALVVMLFYRSLFVHWEVAILAVLLTAALAVATGLLLGILADSPTTASLWGSLLLLIMIGSALLKLFSGLNLPPAIQSALDWLPGSAMLLLFRISQAGEIPPGLLWFNGSVLLAAIAAVSVLLAWRLRTLER